MSRGDIEFAGPGAFSFLARGYRCNPPPGVDLYADGTLKHGNTGVVLVAVLERARRGDRQALPALLHCLDDQHPIISTDSYMLLGHAGSPTLLLQLLDGEYRRMFEPTLNWWSGLHVCKALLAAGFGWVVPPVVHLYMRMAAVGSVRKELGIIPALLQDMLWAPGQTAPLMAAHQCGEAAVVGRETLAIWREVVATHGVHQPLYQGQPFDLRRIVEPLRALSSDPSASMTPTLRRIFESYTGIDCSNWYDRHQARRLQIAADAERFAEGELDRYLVGHRYFAGHLLDDPPERRAEAWSRWALEQCEAAVASALPEPAPEGEDGPGPDVYLYEGLFDSPANHAGDAYDRIAAAAQDAYLGKTAELTPRLLGAVDLLVDDDEFEYRCARLIGDAAPLGQLVAMVEAWHTQLFEQPDPRRQEFAIMALAGAGTLRTLRLASEIIARFDAGQARHGHRPWEHLREALPRLDKSVMRAWLAADGESIRAWFEAHFEKLEGLDDAQVLWAGQPLSLTKLVDELAAVLLEDAPHLWGVYALRHALETMTGINLAALWTKDATLDVSAGMALVERLRGEPVVVEHVPGTRIAFGHIILRPDPHSGE